MNIEQGLWKKEKENLEEGSGENGLDRRLPGDLDGYFIIGMTGIDLEEDPSVEYFDAAGDVL